MLQLFHCKNTGAFADHHAIAIFIKGPAGLFRVLIIRRKFFKQRMPGHAENIDSAFCATTQEKVASIPAKKSVGFAECQNACDIALRNGIIGPLCIMKNGNLAGKHVGKILQHPEGLNDFKAFMAPDIEIHFDGITRTGNNSSICKFI